MNNKYSIALIASLLLASASSHADITISNNGQRVSAHLMDQALDGNISEYLGLQLHQNENDAEPTVTIFAESGSARFSCKATASSIGTATYQILESFASNLGQVGLLQADRSNGFCENILVTNLLTLPNPGKLRDYAPFEDGDVDGPYRAIEIPQQETFEAYPISWHSPNTHFFTPWSGQTPSSNTGPSGARSGMYYGVLETSLTGRLYHSGESYYGANRAGDFATLESGYLPQTIQSLSFNYFMFGSDVGTLAVDIMDANGVWQNSLWQRSGQQHTSLVQAWSSATVNVQGAIKVRLRAVADGGYTGDIAIDNVSVQ